MTADQMRPLTPLEMVPCSALRDLAMGDPMRQMGEMSEEHQAMLAMYLPEICGELLAYRAAATGSTPPAVQRRGSILRHIIPAVRATDGRRDCPYNGQPPAPGTSLRATANG
jgi:hypothetical protein